MEHTFFVNFLTRSELLIDIITLAHLQKNRPKTTVLQRNAIIAGEDLEAEMEEQEWYYGSSSGGTGEQERNGPVSLSELKRLYNEESISERTKVWAQGMEGWRQLQSWGSKYLGHIPSVPLCQICVCFGNVFEPFSQRTAVEVDLVVRR